MRVRKDKTNHVFVDLCVNSELLAFFRYASEMPVDEEGDSGRVRALSTEPDRFLLSKFNAVQGEVRLDRVRSRELAGERL